MNKVILTGAFARSNMGHEVTAGMISAAIKHPPKYPADASISFCSDLMESAEHEAMFADEADMWAVILEPLTDAAIELNWPHIVTKYREAEVICGVSGS